MGGGDESEDRSYAPDGANGVHRQGRLIQPWIAAGRMPRDLKVLARRSIQGSALGAKSTGRARPRIVMEERNDSGRNGPPAPMPNRNPLSESE